MDNGLGGSIMTFWEITEGDLTDEKGGVDMFDIKVWG